MQKKHNTVNNIQPKTIVKDEKTIKSSTLVADADIDEIIKNNISNEALGLEGLELKEMIKNIERKMLNYAKEFQFEKAALLRDQLTKLKNEI